MGWQCTLQNTLQYRKQDGSSLDFLKEDFLYMSQYYTLVLYGQTDQVVVGYTVWNLFFTQVIT